MKNKSKYKYFVEPRPAGSLVRCNIKTNKCQRYIESGKWAHSTLYLSFFKIYYNEIEEEQAALLLSCLD